LSPIAELALVVVVGELAGGGGGWPDLVVAGELKLVGVWSDKPAVSCR